LGAGVVGNGNSALFPSSIDFRWKPCKWRFDEAFKELYNSTLINLIHILYCPLFCIMLTKLFNKELTPHRSSDDLRVSTTWICCYN
jgi:hypothetical protein